MAAFKTKTEKLAAVHNHWMLRLSDLVKDVVKYTEDLHRLHKKVKEDESTTLEAVKSIQETTALLQKSKEAYKQRCLEVERQKRDGVTGNKDLDKSEVKFRKAQEEYRSLVDKYCQCRDDFERKMTLSSKRFQEVEETHLKQMRLFVESYCQIVDNNNNQWGRVSAWDGQGVRPSKRMSQSPSFSPFSRPDPPRVPDPAGGADAGEPPGAVHFVETHGSGETRSVGAI